MQCMHKYGSFHKQREPNVDPQILQYLLLGPPSKCTPSSVPQSRLSTGESPLLAGCCPSSDGLAFQVCAVTIFEFRSDHVGYSLNS